MKREGSPSLAAASAEAAQWQKNTEALPAIEETLEETAARLGNENVRQLQQITALQEYTSRLTNLYVASYQLQGTVTRKRVLEAISEIVINMIGSEDFGVYELDDDTLTMVCGFGPVDLRQIDLGDHAGMLWQSVERGELLLGETAAEAVACIPLKVDGHVNGVIAIFSLLEHKAELEPLDHELFALLGTHAATALYSSGLQLRLVRVARNAA
jgi:hypothetical protein